MNKPTLLAIALSLVALGGSAFAQQPTPQQPGAACDHHGGRGGHGERGPRPEMQPADAQGAVTRILLGPGGQAHGVQLADGTIVMARRAAAGLSMGQRIQVSGLAAPGASPRVIVRPTIRDASGNVIAQAPERGEGGHRGGFRGRGGPDGAGREAMRARFEAMRARMEALPEVRVDGPVQAVVSGPRGGVRSLLLANNTTLAVPRPLARQLAEHGVRAGDRIRAVGRGGTYPQGTSLVAREITLPDDTRLALPPRPAR